jgi:hypothetical protein
MYTVPLLLPRFMTRHHIEFLLYQKQYQKFCIFPGHFISLHNSYFYNPSLQTIPKEFTVTHYYLNSNIYEIHHEHLQKYTYISQNLNSHPNLFLLPKQLSSPVCIYGVEFQKME